MGYIYLLVIGFFIWIVAYFAVCCMRELDANKRSLSVEFSEWLHSGDLDNMFDAASDSFKQKRQPVIPAAELTQDDILHSKKVQAFIRRTMNQLNQRIKQRNKNGYQFLECYVDTPAEYTTELRRAMREEIKNQLFNAGYYVEIKPDNDFYVNRAYFGEFFIQWGEKGLEKRRAIFEKTKEGNEKGTE